MQKLTRKFHLSILRPSAWIVGLPAIVLLVFIPHGAMGQIYSEDFESLSVGATTDDDGVWSLDASGADIAASEDHFEIKERSGDLLLEGQDLDGPAIWETDQSSIDISSAANPQFSLVISEAGDMETGDYVDVEYSTDGGNSFTLIENYEGLGDSNHTLTGNFGSVTVRETGLSGSPLVLRVTMENSAGSEQHRLDDVTVTDPVLKFTPTETKVAENDGSTTLTVELLDATSAPSADVAFQSGASTASTSDIDNYSTQSVSFSSSAAEGDTKDVTVTLTDDSDQEGLETAEFALTNVGEPTGGPFTLKISDTEVVINEVLADPPSGNAGDANGDGTRDSANDEFIEIYNNSNSQLDLTDFSLGDEGGSSRHTFPQGTILDPGESVVVFGGGSPANSIPGIVQTASDGRLSLSNSGDDILVSDASGNPYLTFAYGSEGGEDESLTRDPDFTGDFVKHSNADGAGGDVFSPGEETDGTALPVELASLNAVSVDGGAQLTWRTASETNNARFEVEHKRSEKDVGWAEVGTVPSKASGGTSTDLTAYSYRVEDLAVGTHRFRLRQVDLDGTATLTDSVSVDVGMQEALVLSTPAPNPASADATVSFAVKEPVQTTIRLYNTLGQRVRTLYRGRPPAEQEETVRIETTGLASGAYFLRLRAGDQTRTQQITVVR
jgi:hypothetical protein